MSHGAGIYLPAFLSLQAVHVVDFDRTSTVQFTKLRSGRGQRHVFERKTSDVLVQGATHTS
jgi:hypothetical protein